MLTTWRKFKQTITGRSGDACGDRADGLNPHRQRGNLTKPHQKRALAVVAVAVAAVMVVSACGGSSGGSSDGKPGDVTIRIGTQPGIVTSNLVKEAKTLETEGYKVEWVSFSSAGDEMQALAGGSLDVMAAGAAPEMLLGAKYENAAFVATTVQIGTQFIIPADSSISSIKDLKGKSIAYPGPGSQQYALLSTLLDNNDMTVDDVKLYKTDATGMPALLEKGTVDAFASWNPFASESVRTGSGKVLIDSQTIFQDAGGKGTWMSEGWIANRKFMKENPAAMQAVMNAVAASNDVCRNDLPKAVDGWSNESGLEPAAIEFAFKEEFVACSASIVPSVETVQSMVQLMIDSGLIEGVKAKSFAADFVEQAFAEKAMTTLEAQQK